MQKAAKLVNTNVFRHVVVERCIVGHFDSVNSVVVFVCKEKTHKIETSSNHPICICIYNLNSNVGISYS